MKYLLLTLALGLISCGYTNGKRQEVAEPEANSRLDDLRSEYSVRLTKLKGMVDADGYPGRTDCDLTLWMGEARYTGLEVNLDLVELAPGVIHRRPTPCWTKEQGDLGGPSSVSGDILNGYMLGRWTERNLGAFQRLAAVGEKRFVYFPIPGWVMGEPYPEMASRVVLRPTGIGLVGRVIYALSNGEDDRSYRKWIPLYGPGQDFERHVQTVGILTDGLAAEAARKKSLVWQATEKAPGSEKLTLDLTLSELDALKSFVETDPDNYFFASVYSRYSGDTSRATELLLNPDTPVPGYVRGAHRDAYELIHWLASAKTVLDLFPVTE